MDDRDFWGLVDLLHDDAEDVGTPTETVLMHRALTANCTDVLWIHGYPAVRWIVVTVMPARVNEHTTVSGVVREIPVGFRDMASPETFRAAVMRIVASYAEQGWVRKDPTVHSGAA